MALHFHNRRILITRQEPKASAFAEKIKAYGGEPIVTPLIKVCCKTEPNHRKMLSQIHRYEWIFFTSANGVHCFFEKVHLYVKANELNQTRFAVVGSKTNETLQTYGYTADFIPSTYNAKTMAPEFLEKYQPTKPVLIVRGQRSGTVLNEAFTQKNILFDVIEVYETIINDTIKSHLQNILENETIDYLTFTSPSTIDALVKMANHQKLLEKKIVCIGTTTERRAKQYGFHRILTPNVFTIEGMMQVMNQDIS